MSKALEERLNGHSNAFDGLLSLIPAKYYFDDDTQDQWLSKKQSKEQARSKKRAKLAPGAVSSALDAQKKIEEEKSLASEEINQESDHGDSDVDVYDDDGNIVQMNGWQEPEEEKSKQDKEEQQKKEQQGQSPKKAALDPERARSIQELRDRLASRINELREKRKAPASGAKGAPQNREALLAARKTKQEARKRKREEARAQGTEKTEKEDNEQEEDEEEEEKESVEESELLFGQVKFKDGQVTAANLKSLKAEKKLKKRDLAGQLKHVQAKRAKVSGLEPTKQADISDKHQWSRAILQAEGSKVRDDEVMLKKSLKQQQKRKRKSEMEWKERKENVDKGIQMRVKKREENLATRRAMKGVKGKKRAGFEGKKFKKRK